jgi:hypothetical protein
MKSGQRAKVARDALKLITLARAYPDAKLILALADAECAKPLQFNTWLAASLKAFDIEVMVRPLDQAARNGIVTAQALQVMTNPAGAPTPAATQKS